MSSFRSRVSMSITLHHWRADATELDQADMAPSKRTTRHLATQSSAWRRMDCGGKAECVATAASATETYEGRTPSEPAYGSNLARLLKAVNAGESGNRETQGGTNTGELTSQNGNGRYSRRAPARLRVHALNRSVGGKGCVSEAVH